MAEAINQHKALAMGKKIQPESPAPSNKSVKGSGKDGPKSAAKNY